MSIIWNKPEIYFNEMAKGLQLVNKNLFSYQDLEGHLVMRKETGKDKVVVIGISDGGHFPLYQGYVGKGFLDGCVIGDIFRTPSASQIYELSHTLDSGKGIFLLYGNDYEGIQDQVEEAIFLLEKEGHHVRAYVVHDNAVMIPPLPFEKRKSTPGALFLAKIACAAAEKGKNLEEISDLVETCGSNLRSMGAIVKFCEDPISRQCKNEIEEGYMNIGGQYHGEVGFETIPFSPAEVMADHMFRKMINLELCLQQGDKVAVLLTGLGATPLESLYVYYDGLVEAIEKTGAHIVISYVGIYATSLNTNGISCSILKLEEGVEELLLEKTETMIQL